MPFRPVSHEHQARTRWGEITHLRLVGSPDTEFARLRWDTLRKLADPDGLVPITEALAALEPVRAGLGDREAAIRQDLRNWSNPREHGNNSQDKGWLELGFVTDD